MRRGTVNITIMQVFHSLFDPTSHTPLMFRFQSTRVCGCRWHEIFPVTIASARRGAYASGYGVDWRRFPPGSGTELMADCTNPSNVSSLTSSIGVRSRCGETILGLFESIERQELSERSLWLCYPRHLRINSWRSDETWPLADRVLRQSRGSAEPFNRESGASKTFAKAIMSEIQS
jgi:hypothetical protein